MKVSQNQYAETLLKAITGSRLAVYPGVGHAIHWEWAERFAADLIAFTDFVGETAW